MPTAFDTIQIPPVGTPHDPVEFNGIEGVNNSMSDDIISNNELSDARNFVLDLNAGGGLVKRDGITKHTSVALTEPVTSIFDGEAGDYFTTNTLIYKLDGTELVSGLSSVTDPDWTSFTNKAGTIFDIYVDGTNQPRKTSNGTSFSNITAAPTTLKCIESFNNMLFGISGHILYWSSWGDEETWPAVNTLTFDHPLRGLKQWKDALVLFTDFEFFYLDATNEVNVFITAQSREEGCTSHRSVIPTPYGLFFWTKSGPAVIPPGTTQVQYIAQPKIPKTLNGLNRSKYSLIHGCWNVVESRIEYYVFNGSSTTVDLCLMFYPATGSWFLADGDGIKMGACGMVQVSGTPTLYLGSASSTGYVYTQSGDTDDGVSVAAYIESKRLAPISPVALKRARRSVPMLYLSGSGTIDVGVYWDNSLTVSETWQITTSATQGFILDTDQLDYGQLGSGEEPKEFQISHRRRYRKAKYRIYDSTAFQTRFRSLRLDGFLLRT